MKLIKNYSDYLKEAHPAEYKAPKGSARDKKLKKAQELLKGSEADKKRAYELRDDMEKQVREKRRKKRKKLIVTGKHLTRS